MDSYAQRWRAYRFWNRLGILVVVALLPVVVFGAFLTVGGHQTHAVASACIVLWS